MKKRNWKSNKTIAVILILAIVLLALLITGIVFAVKHRRAESLPAAVPGTTAESLTTEPAETETATGSGATTAATTAVSATAAGAPAAANNGSSDKSSKPSGGSSGTNSKPSGSNTKPSGGSGGSGSNTSGAKPVTTTNPAKKEFAMTKQEIIDYATDYIVNTYHCKYCDLFGKDVPGTGYIPPSVFTRDDTAEYMKAMLRGCADATYGPNGWYKVYVEMEDEDTMRVYMFYA